MATDAGGVVTAGVVAGGVASRATGVPSAVRWLLASLATLGGGVRLLGVAPAPVALEAGVWAPSADNGVVDALAYLASLPLTPSTLRAVLAALGDAPGTCWLTRQDH